MSDKIFDINPNLKAYYKTNDGTAFYTENDAKNHARGLKDKTVEKVRNIKNIEVQSEDVQSDDFLNPLSGLNLNDTKELLNAISDIETLEKCLQVEKQGENRKGAIDAIEKRIKELTA